MKIHVVQPGESLWLISQKYNVPIQALITINGLISPYMIIPGLALYIPLATLPTRAYQVVAGDTLWRIAARFQSTIPQILTANPGLNPNQIIIGQKLTIPSPFKKTISTLGFVIPYSTDSFLSHFTAIAQELTYIAIVSYSFTDEGYAYIELEDDQMIEKSKQLGVAPLLMIRNFKNGEFDRKLAGNVLGNSDYRGNLIASIVNFIQTKGYSGVSIDFEFIPPPQRNNFIIFLNELKKALNNHILHVNVHAKTEDIPNNPIIGAYDYKEIGNIADIVAVMTIDYGYPTGPPNPVSPIWWMEQVVRYTISQIDPNKLQIAFPLYGYDWKIANNVTTALSVLAAQNLAITAGTVINFNTIAQAPYYRYWKNAEEHIVWFEDTRSIVEKYALLDLYNLLGVTFWHLNLHFPQNWAYLEENFHVEQ